MFRVVLRNASTRADITPEWLSRVAAALTLQFARDFCPAYGLALWHAVVDQGPGPQIVIFDTADQANALGYHSTLAGGMPYGKVFADGQSLDGISVTLSHEALELVRDQDASGFRVGLDGTAYADEACDAVEDVTYEIGGVQVSDFVLPAWYVDGSPGPWDRCAVLRGPHERTAGGYTIQLRAGQVTTDPPEAARRPGKTHPASRTARRLARGARREAA